jgi:ABC-2 type transport system permease protein
VAILIYRSGAGFPGWAFHEVLLIQAIFTISSGVAGTFFRGVFWQTNFNIREGTFEVALLKPLGTLPWLLVSSIQLENSGMIAGGAVMAGIALSRAGAPSPGGVLACLALFSGGVCVMLGITLVMAGAAFKWVGNSRMPEIFDSVLDFAKYPQSVFPSGVRIAAALVLPVAMIGFFPASALLGRAEPFHFIALAPCVLFAGAGIAFFNAMVRHYEGVGG